MHYSGGGVVHHGYDNRTQQYPRQTLFREVMDGGYISHMPAKHFEIVFFIQ